MNRVKMKELFFKKKINGRNYFKRESCEKITCEELNHMEINGSCGEKKRIIQQEKQKHVNRANIN